MLCLGELLGVGRYRFSSGWPKSGAFLRFILPTSGVACVVVPFGWERLGFNGNYKLPFFIGFSDRMSPATSYWFCHQLMASAI